MSSQRECATCHGSKNVHDMYVAQRNEEVKQGSVQTVIYHYCDPMCAQMPLPKLTAKMSRFAQGQYRWYREWYEKRGIQVPALFTLDP